MANNAAVFNTIPNNVLLFSVAFKFITMIIGILGNVTVIIYTVFSNKEKTATSYLVGNLALADLLVCSTLYPIWIVELIQIMLNIDSNQDLFCKYSRSTIWAFMFASIATLLAITVDRYLYIVKPLRYPQIVTQRRVWLAVLGIWITACCLFVVQYIHRRSFGINGLRNVCYLPSNILHFTNAFVGYFTFTFIFLLNFHILYVARKQRRRIMAETKVASVIGFFAALKAAKTFATVVAVLTFCILIPTVVGSIIAEFCSDACKQIWFVVVHYELNGINSVVNVFIYGMRHVKYRKAYLHILFKLFFCQKATN